MKIQFLCHPCHISSAQWAYEIIDHSLGHHKYRILIFIFKESSVGQHLTQ